MTNHTTLTELLGLPHETEWVEFKEAKQSFSFEEIGRYFSALSNEANLKQKPEGWLVFGVQDKPRQIVGTNYRNDPQSLDSLKQEAATHTTGRRTPIA
jgi:ATP-dependent DNA helicase RecG